jgi:hypothetical protein
MRVVRAPDASPAHGMTDADGSGIGWDAVPEGAQIAWMRLRDQLHAILGDDLVAIWAHGGTIAPDAPPHAADLDTYVIVARRPDDPTIRRVEAALDAIADANGVEWDAWFVVADEAGRAEHPTHAFREGQDSSWAIHRSHWLAGRYVSLLGPAPAAFVRAPSWADVEAELSRELEHLERHVVEGDTDPFEATYAVLNGCRILYAHETHDVAISKAGAGEWGLAHLPERWHAVLRAAARAYAGGPAPDDAALLAAEMAPFVSMVRSRLSDPGPPPWDRPPNS